jgi:hypothetical protein
MGDIKGVATLLCRRMGVGVVRRLLSVTEKELCGGGDDVIPVVKGICNHGCGGDGKFYGADTCNSCCGGAGYNILGACQWLRKLVGAPATL